MTALFAAAAFAGGTTATAVAAPTGPTVVAAPSNCTVSTLYSSVSAYCANGTGEYRAYTRCDATLWPDYNRYGPWTRAGSGPSTAYCEDIDRAFNYGVQVR
ncbi:hypothetical protein [Actinophytocola sp.]|uniref:hypothetical protein n=1 Tax=Actinophytocola sp. TaxID=1872138 RepID=UPI002ED480FC